MTKLQCVFYNVETRQEQYTDMLFTVRKQLFQIMHPRTTLMCRNTVIVGAGGVVLFNLIRIYKDLGR